MHEVPRALDGSCARSEKSPKSMSLESATVGPDCGIENKKNLEVWSKELILPKLCSQWLVSDIRYIGQNILINPWWLAALLVIHLAPHHVIKWVMCQTKKVCFL